MNEKRLEIGLTRAMVELSDVGFGARGFDGVGALIIELFEQRTGHLLDFSDRRFFARLMNPRVDEADFDIIKLWRSWD